MMYAIMFILFYVEILAFQTLDEYNFLVGSINTHLCNSTCIRASNDFSNAALVVCYISSALNTLSQLHTTSLLLIIMTIMSSLRVLYT